MKIFNSNKFTTIDRTTLKAILHKREKFSHKGDYGHGFLVAGSFGMGGAAVLAAKGAMRSGLGLLTVHLPKSLYEIMQISVPEAMCTIDRSEYIFTSCFGSLLDGFQPKKECCEVDKYSAIAIGPGIGKAPETVYALKELLSKYSRPMILDADALNIISYHKELLELIPKNSILTPHPKEFARVVGSYSHREEGFEMQMEFSKRENLIVVLKGAESSISTPCGSLWLNSLGNPGMATAGSGDVLTGIILGLLTQGYSPIESAISGVYLHALAGDKAAATRGEASLVASDIIDHLGEAFISIFA